MSVVKKYWEDTKIVGVDLDPKIIELGRKYLKLGKSDVEVHISDASDFLSSVNSKRSAGYDLILVDLYVGRDFPKKFEKDSFIKLVKKALAKDGVAVFNRLYYDEKRKESMKFGEKLEKYFRKVEIIFPEANVMFVCDG